MPPSTTTTAASSTASTWRPCAIDEAINVGSVPKYVAVTSRRPLRARQQLVLLRPQRRRRRDGEQRSSAIPLGPYPRGIAVSPRLTLAVRGARWARRHRPHRPGHVRVSVDRRASATGPRHLVLGPAGRFLYATLNGEGASRRSTCTAGTVLAKVAHGHPAAQHGHLARRTIALRRELRVRRR